MITMIGEATSKNYKWALCPKMLGSQLYYFIQPCSIMLIMETKLNLKPFFKQIFSSDLAFKGNPRPSLQSFRSGGIS